MKKANKFLGIILSLTLILCIMQGVFIPVSAQETEAIQEIELSEEEFYALNKPQFSVDDDFADNRVIVVLKNGKSLKFKEYKITDFSGLGCKKVNDLTSHTGEIIKKKIESQNVDAAAVGLLNTDMFIENKISDVNVNKYNQILCLELGESGKQNVLDVIDELNARDDVLYAMPDIAISESATSNDPSLMVYTDSNGNSTYMYHVHQQISLYDAWDICTGSSSVTVGVIDSGIQGTHPDLVNRINTSLCMDFRDGGAVAVTAPVDPSGHGTHVAGIIGAQGNNGIGIAGVCWNVRLASLRVLDEDGCGYLSDVGQAVDYANQKRIPILNASLGWGEGSVSCDEDISPIISNYFGLFICAAGNEGANNDNVPLYPASYNLDNMIVVGASSNHNEIKADSNYGQNTVDIFAPGANIVSCANNSDYEIRNGSSMATAYVSGVAALLLADNPGMKACEIKATIMEYADMLSAYQGKCVSGGRLNAYEALSNPVSHTFSYANIGSSLHMATCTVSGCGYQFVESHSFVQLGSFYRCTKCGYTDSDAPGVLDAIIPDDEEDYIDS